MTLENSSVPGFRVKDFDTTCPATGQQCLVQQQIICEYLGDITNGNLSNESYRDQAIVTAKLLEYKLSSKAINYDGAEFGDCRTRKAMDASELRSKTLKAGRGILNLFGRKGE